jgi:hypothetical protein
MSELYFEARENAVGTYSFGTKEEILSVNLTHDQVINRAKNIGKLKNTVTLDVRKVGGKSIVHKFYGSK